MRYKKGQFHCVSMQGFKCEMNFIIIIIVIIIIIIIAIIII